MKIIIIHISLLLICLSGKCQTQEKVFFYSEENNNKAKEILTYNNKLYIFGSHHLTENEIERNSTILCVDTNLVKIWDRHFGNTKSEERFNSFCIDSNGNFYLTGQNKLQAFGILIKLDTNGKQIWRKEFKEISEISKIKLVNNQALIIMGRTKHKSNNLLQDSSFIQRNDLNGNTLWQTKLNQGMGVRFLSQLNDKILFCSSSSTLYPPNQYSNLYSLSLDGTIDWYRKMDKLATGYHNNIVSNFIVLNSNEIYVLIQSYRTMKIRIQLIHFNNLGVKISSIDSAISAINLTSNSADSIYLRPHLIVNRPEGVKGEILIGKRKENDLYFYLGPSKGTEVDADSVNLLNNIFTISNILNNDNFYDSKWAIRKSQSLPKPKR